jgi:hypothetical protein
MANCAELAFHINISLMLGCFTATTNKSINNSRDARIQKSPRITDATHNHTTTYMNTREYTHACANTTARDGP